MHVLCYGDERFRNWVNCVWTIEGTLCGRFKAFLSKLYSIKQFIEFKYNFNRRTALKVQTSLPQTVQQSVPLNSSIMLYDDSRSWIIMSLNINNALNSSIMLYDDSRSWINNAIIDEMFILMRKSSSVVAGLFAGSGERDIIPHRIGSLLLVLQAALSGSQSPTRFLTLL